MLVAAGLHRAFGRVTALAGFDLTVDSGEVVGCARITRGLGAAV